MLNSGNFSIRFWRLYVSLFASIAAIVVPIVDFRQKKFPLFLQMEAHAGFIAVCNETM